MSSSRRTRCRHQRHSFPRQQLRFEGLERRYALNSAPVLDDAASPALLSIAEDVSAPIGEVGTLVSSLIDTSGTHNNFSDADGDLPGIAITGVNLQGGTLWYSTDNGSTWLNIDAVSEASPRLLSANSTTRLYFEPPDDFSGTISDVISVKAWDHNVVWQRLGLDINEPEEFNGFSVSMSVDDNVVAQNNPTSTVTFVDLVNTISETTDTSDIIRIAGVIVADDAFAYPRLSGPDASFFQILFIGSIDPITGRPAMGMNFVYLNRGVVLDALNKPSLHFTVELSDSFVGGNIITASHTLLILNVNDLPTGDVTITGVTTEDEVLTASNTLEDADGIGAISYQWNRNGIAISAAVSSTYTLVQADVGAVITVTASYVDLQGTAESVTSSGTSVVTNVNDLPTGDVTITGVTTEDEVLTASNTLEDADGIGAISYQWNRNGIAISAAVSSTYTLVQADVGAVITVTASYVDLQGTAESVTSSGTSVVTNVNDLPTGDVTITGVTTEDEVLTASNTLEDADGIGAISYQWNRNGIAISAAASSTYTLVQADVGAVITVTASYVDLQGTAESVTSSGTSVVTNVNDLPTGDVTITGVTTEDEVLTASNTLEDADGIGAISYQWNRNGIAISAAASSTYTLVQADVGAVISVTVSYTDAENSFESVTSSLSSTVLGVNNSPVLDPTASPQLDSVFEDAGIPTGQVGTLVSSLVDSGAPDDVLDFPATVLPGITIGNLPSGYETSGLTWHDGLQKLFAVSDESIISMMNADGTELVNWNVLGDLEALTVADHTSTKIYIGVEHPDSIFEFDVSTGQVTRTFELTNWMTGADSKGLESLAFVPDASHPEGGLFYAGLQEDGRIYQFSLPIATSSSSTAVNFVQSISIEGGSTDLAGLTYESSSGQLLAIFDSIDQLNVIDRDGQLRSRWTVPGAGQEAVVFIEGHLYIGDDTLGSITRYSGFDALIETGGTHDNFSDVDGDLPGIAITGVNLQGGTLWYSTNNGSTWLDVGPVSDAVPRGLSADTTTRIYYKPTSDFAGTVSDVISFKAWDGFLNWHKLGLDIDGEAANDQSAWGLSLSADGQTVAVGARFNDGNGNNSGHTRIYHWTGSAWQQLGLDIDGEAANDQSGVSVSLSADGQTVVIGAFCNDGNGNDSGHTRIYHWTGSTWQQLGLDIDGEAALDQSAWALSLSADGQTVAVGARFNDGNGDNSGHTRIYHWTGSVWQQLGLDIDGEAALDESGFSVSLSADGQTVAVGARYNDGNGDNSGHTRIYHWTGSAWQQLGLDIDGEAALDQSAWALSLSADGQTVAVGARFNDGNGNNSGHTRIYHWTGSAWQQLGLDIDGEAANDHSGVSVSLSADGQTVAIGAIYNDGNGNESGHTRIYHWTGSVWQQLGLDIDGEAALDRTAWALSLSADGQTVAIGARSYDGNNDASGHTRIYQLTPSASSLSTVTDTISIGVTPVNDQPTLDAITGATIFEDAAEQVMSLSDISAGGSETQPLRVMATSSNPGLIPNPSVTYTSADSTGSLAFTPVADQHGTATITMTVEDGGLDNDLATVGDNATFSQSFDVTVTPVNDIPTLGALDGFTILEDAPEQMVSLSDIIAGGGEAQPLRVTASSSNHGLIPNPSVTYTSADSTGSLAFTPIADQHGTATITVTVEDGGRDNDLATVGDNATFSQSFDVTVSAVNNFSAPILDQSNTSSEDPAFNGSSNGTRGQTFTVGVAGMLSSIDSLIKGLVTLQLHTTNEQGLPENLLGEFVTDTGDTSEFVLHEFDVSSLQYYVTPGDRLAITFIAGVGSINPSGRIGWTRSSYDRGSYIHLEPDGWTAYEDLDTSFGNQHPTSDLAFRTWVSPLEPDHNILLSNLSIAEGNTPDSLVGFLSSENTNGSDEYTFSLVGGLGDSNNGMFQITENQLFLEQSVDYESTSALSVRIRSMNTGGSYVEDTFTIDVTDVNEAPAIDDLTDMFLIENALAQTIVLEGISAGPNESQLLRITATSDNPNLIPSPIVSYTSPNVFGSLVFTPNQDVFGETQITVTVEDAGLDGDLGTSEDNLVVNKVFDVEVFELLPYIGSQALARNSLGQLHVGTQQVLLDDQPVLPNIHGFRVLGAEEIGTGNSLLVARNNILGNETRYRLVTDESWRISGLLDSLQNESSLVLDLTAREVSVDLNVVAVAGAYVVNGVNNPTLTVRRGQTYTFNLNTGIHRLWLQTTGNGYQSANVYSDGFTGNSQTTGEHQWVVPQDAPDEIFYQCEFHPVMFGKIIVVD